MINWMLEVEDVEDDACRVDDMETTNRSQFLVRRGWSGGRGYKGTRVEMIEGHCPRCRRREAVVGHVEVDW